MPDARDAERIQNRMESVRTSSEAQRELRIRAAWIYYIEGRTQQETAEILGLSRVAVTRLLSGARERGEVSIRVKSNLDSIVEIARRLERRFNLEQAVVAPWPAQAGDPTHAIAAAAAGFLASAVKSNMTIGVGWGRTLHATLDFMEGRPLRNTRIVSLLGGIAEAKRFNPGEFAWRFAELFNSEGFLIPAPALVDSPETREALLQRCGLGDVFRMAESSDMALLSCGGISASTTFRTGYMSETERQSLIDSGAVGDVLCQFLSSDGKIVDHPANRRFIAMGLDRLQQIKRTVLISGGLEKKEILLACLKAFSPKVFVTDEQTAFLLVDHNIADA